MALAPAMTLNRMYHCAPSSISATQLIVKGMRSQVTSSTVTSGKSIGAGKLATTCTTGCNRCDQRGLRPMRMPTGSAQAAPSRVAAEVRRKEASRASRTCTQSSPRYQAGAPRSRTCSAVRSWTTFHPPHASPARSAARNSHLKTCAAASSTGDGPASVGERGASDGVAPASDSGITSAGV